MKGPGLWRVGYNSGKANSTNNLFFHTESGINRVSIRSLRAPGTVTVTASRESLEDVTIDLSSQAIEIVEGLSRGMPQMYAQNLGGPEPLPLYSPPMPPLPPNSRVRSNLFTRFSYTGHHKAILRTNSYRGKKAYTDGEVNYTVLPAYLRGNEYIRTPNAHRAYWASDLLRFIAGKDMVIWVGYDDLVERPEFLADNEDIGDDIKLGDTTLSVFRRSVEAGTSIVMSGNSDGEVPDGVRIYVVFGKER